MDKTSQRSKVYDFIVHQIEIGRWKPGDKIFTEQQLGEEIGVSRIAVREATEQCVALGILEKHRGAGTFVQELDIKKLMKQISRILNIKQVDNLDIYKFRRYFEPGNVKEFMKYCTEQDIEALEKTLADMKANIDNREKYYSADYRFHEIIAYGTGNVLVQAVNDLLRITFLTSQAATNQRFGPKISLYYHEEIINMIKAGDREMAALLMKRHMDSLINESEHNN